jgi:Holliday junction resolvasome RuvABC endonuclease subunit
VNILAVDPATRCGWAHSAGASGTWDLSIRRDESAGMRLLRLRGKLEEIRATVGVDLLVYEAARHAAPKMAGALVVQATLQGVLLLWAEQNRVEYRGYSPSEIKKHATGKGNAGKDVMLAAARARWPTVGDDNEADARWLLDLASETYASRPGLTLREVFGDDDDMQCVCWH